MDEMEMRTLQEHTRALDENTKAIRTFTQLLAEIMSVPSFTNGNEVMPMSTVLSRLEEIESRLNSDSRMFTSSVNSMAEISAKNKYAVEMFCDAASRMHRQF